MKIPLSWNMNVRPKMYQVLLFRFRRLLCKALITKRFGRVEIVKLVRKPSLFVSLPNQRTQRLQGRVSKASLWLFPGQPARDQRKSQCPLAVFFIHPGPCFLKGETDSSTIYQWRFVNWMWAYTSFTLDLFRRKARLLQLVVLDFSANLWVKRSFLI